MSHYQNLDMSEPDLCSDTGLRVLGRVPLDDHGDNGAGCRLEWLVSGDPPEGLHDSGVRGDVDD